MNQIVTVVAGKCVVSAECAHILELEGILPIQYIRVLIVCTIIGIGAESSRGLLNR